jgi:hypothetical protein
MNSCALWRPSSRAGVFDAPVMRQVEFAPAGIVELRLFGAGHISEMEKPVCIEDPDPEERLVSGRPSCMIKKCYTVIVITVSYTGALSRWGPTNPRRVAVVRAWVMRERRSRKYSGEWVAEKSFQPTQISGRRRGTYRCFGDGHRQDCDGWRTAYE